MSGPTTRCQRYSIAVALILLSAFANAGIAYAAQDPPPGATEVLDAADRYHDPDDAWFRGSWRITLRETRPGGPDRQTVIVINNLDGAFSMRRIAGDDVIETFVQDDVCEARLNRSTDIPDDERERRNLTCDGMRRTRNYYTYLYGLPMKLRDPGAIVDPDTAETTFDDHPVHAARVTYDPEVGSDIWYFYFDRETHALAGYRFYHDETAGDGEYIRLAGEVEVGGVRLPAERSWHTHQGDRFLGTDTILSIERVE